MASTSTIAQNIDEPLPYRGRVSWASADGDGGTAGPIKTANTAKDGTGIVNTVFTADTNGSILYRIRAIPVGTNVASVLRVFINNGSTNATIANNTPWRELPLPATTLTEADAQFPYELLAGIKLPSGYKIIVTIGTTVAAGWRVMAEGGDY